MDWRWRKYEMDKEQHIPDYSPLIKTLPTSTTCFESFSKTVAQRQALKRNQLHFGMDQSVAFSSQQHLSSSLPFPTAPGTATPHQSSLVSTLLTPTTSSASGSAVSAGPVGSVGPSVGAFGIAPIRRPRTSQSLSYIPSSRIPKPTIQKIMKKNCEMYRRKAGFFYCLRFSYLPTKEIKKITKSNQEENQETRSTNTRGLMTISNDPKSFPELRKKRNIAPLVRLRLQDYYYEP